MKRMFLTALILMLLGFGLWAESCEKPVYGNVFFSVWRLDADCGNISEIINAPIEKSIKESWLFESITFDLTETNSDAQIINKDSFKFHLSVDSDKMLLITLSENSINIFTFKHHRSSTARYIFYGSDFVPFLINITFTIDDHPIGIIGPGIRKSSEK